MRSREQWSTYEDTIIDDMGNEKRVMLPLHGRIANTPASKVEAFVGLESPFKFGVRGKVYEQTAFGTNLKLYTSITTTIGSNWIKIHDIVENLRGVSAEMQLLYHCNYSRPYLEEGSRFLAPAKRVAPREPLSSKEIEKSNSFGPPETDFVEQVYFINLIGDKESQTRVMLANKSETKAVSISFSLKQLPYFTLWKHTASVEDGYVVGLEPATNFPNHKRFERQRGRVANLKPEKRYATEIILVIHHENSEIQAIKKEIEKLQGRRKTKIFSDPIPEFSPR